ncbi:hypothetical protein [Streptacidiphilus anmyonensis]|uniref:hypothetical protein n=1 Tax=Streptacidiphilus anmyonensis TaxID=405782 RepID=UPI000693A703|nr:hypothetical protein [Streptacidiphilus anmyonensis]
MGSAVTQGTGTDATSLPEQRTGEGEAAPASVPLRLELLVHGVGGTTPEVMLESPHLKQMTGDSMSGTYRRWPDQDAEQNSAAYEGDAVLEAYSWAKLTSGAASRALWLLLLPFMFANLVHWMRPPGPPGADGGAADARLRGAYSALARLLAVSLTVLLTAAACEIAMDLAAWQCAADGACAARHSWVVFALGGHGGWWGQLGRRLVVAALVPLVMLAGLGQLARMTWSSYERVRPMKAPRTGDAPIEMETDGFWYGVATVGRLRALHLAAGLLTVAWTVVVPVIAHDRQAAPGRAWIGIVLLALLVAVGALLLASLSTGADLLTPRMLAAAVAGLAVLVFVYAAWSRPAWVADGRLPGAERGFAALLAGQLLLVAALTGIALTLTRGRSTTKPSAPLEPTAPAAPAAPASSAATAESGDSADSVASTEQAEPIDPAVPTDPSAAVGLSGSTDSTAPEKPGGAERGASADSPVTASPAAPASFAATADSGEPLAPIDPAAPVDPTLIVPSPGLGAPEPADSGFGGPGGGALRGLAGPATALLALGLGALFTSGSALLIAQRLAGPGDPVQAVPLLVWHASGTTLLAPVLLAVVVRLVVPLLRARKTLRPAVLAAYDEPPTTDSPRTGQITTALAGARLTEAGTGVIGTLALAAALQLLVALVGALVSGESLTAASADLGMVGSRLGEMLQSLGGWLTTAFLVGLVALGRSAYTSPARRRTVGVLWDIGTFWPRAAHPLAPPCYAERAVPDIEARVRTWLAADPARRLVLSAHSQGTILAAAALWQLDPATRGRVALLTYGSPLRRLYGRFFPAYMGPDQLMRLQRDMPRWDNLFRLTDPIGGPVRIPACAGSPAPDQPAFPDPLSFGRSEEYPILVPVNGHFDYRLDPRFLVARDALLRAIEDAPAAVG